MKIEVMMKDIMSTRRVLWYIIQGLDVIPVRRRLKSVMETLIRPTVT
jgi:hypothetical protein